MKKTIGILGGMGPMATCDIFQKITELTEAATDQEHCHIVIDSNTNIPSRVDAILSGGESPLPQLIESAVRLEKAGADFLIMPCNTAHYFYNEILPHVHIPFVNMAERTVSQLKAQGVGKAALLATTATVEAGIYDPYFQAQNIELMRPDKATQDCIMSHIFDGIKAGKLQQDVTLLRTQLKALQEAGAEVFVLACTEIPLLFQHNDLDFPIVDATLVLAKEAVRQAQAQ